MKKFLSIVLALSLIFGVVLGLGVTANALSDSGKCGKNVIYTFDWYTGLLTISGTGDMYDYDDWSFYSPFYNSTDIKTVVINSGVTSIGGYAFDGCSELTSVTIPDSVTSIEYYAFAYCRALTSITIPGSVTRIGEDTFCYCSGLTSVTIGNGVTSIGDGAFYDCTSLTELTIPGSVTSIGDYAFCYCSGLTSVTIGNGVKSIGEGVFDQCSLLEDVYYGGTKEDLNNIHYFDLDLYTVTIHFNSTSGETVKYTISNLASTGGTVYVYNGSELVSSADSADGTFTLEGVANGTYDVYVKCKFGVLTKVAMALNVDGTELEPVEDVYIPIGDVNTDGLIDVSDISSILLDGIYATANEDYDIDGSGAVDINDVSTVLLASNYGASAATIG